MFCIMATIIDPSISYIIYNNLAEYKDLFEKCCPQRFEFPRNTILSRTGSRMPSMFFLLSGMVKIYTTNPNGYTRILGYHRRNTLFAMDRICEDEPAVVTVETVTPITALTVSWENIVKMGNLDHSFPNALLKYYGTVLRLMCFDAEIKSVCDASSRLATFLCLFKVNSKDEEIRLTQDELASAVNASRVQIARICSDFKAQGLITTERGKIKILDFERLSKISQYY